MEDDGRLVGVFVQQLAQDVEDNGQRDEAGEAAGSGQEERACAALRNGIAKALEDSHLGGEGEFLGIRRVMASERKGVDFQKDQKGYLQRSVREEERLLRELWAPTRRADDCGSGHLGRNTPHPPILSAYCVRGQLASVASTSYTSMATYLVCLVTLSLPACSVWCSILCCPTSRSARPTIRWAARRGTIHSD